MSKRTVEERLKSLEEWRDAVTQACFQTPKAPQTKIPIIERFPVDLQEHLKEKDGKIYAEYVSSEKFAAIAQAAEKLGYERVVAGKDSHWRKKK